MSEAAQTTKKNWFARHKILTVAIIVIGLFIIGSAASIGTQPNDRAETTTNNTSDTQSTSEVSSPEVQAEPEPSVPVEYRSALAQADTYANSMHMSKQGLYDQLTSEYGGQFTAEAAQYAIDNITADWNANALAKAKTYQNDMHLSPAAIRDQLTSAYGEKFTASEADYAIVNLNK